MAISIPDCKRWHTYCSNINKNAAIQTIMGWEMDSKRNLTTYLKDCYVSRKKIQRKRLLRTQQAGFAIAIVLCAILLLFVIGIGLTGIGMQRRAFAVHTCSGIAARCAADAGLTKAMLEMNEKLQVKPWDDSSLPCATDEPLPDCDATLSYTVTGDKHNGYNITSVGKYGLQAKEVQCSLKLESPFDTAIFGKELISLKPGTTIDSYNCQIPDGCLKIGTESTLAGAVIARSGVTIDGDIFVGPGGDPDVVIDSRHEAAITGSTYALKEEFQTPAIKVPEYLQNLPSIGIITNSMTLYGPTRCEKIELGNNQILTIDGPVDLYCNGSCTFDVLSCLLIVDANVNPDAYLNLYLDGDFMAKNSSAINNCTKDPRKLKIYGLENCTTIDFLIESIFYGAIYAPTADVVLRKSVEVYGAVIANSFTQQVSANFHYDAALIEGSVTDEMVSFVIKQWSED